MGANKGLEGATREQRGKLERAEAAYRDGDDEAAVATLEALLRELSEQGTGGANGANDATEAGDAVRVRLALSQARAGQAEAALATLDAMKDPAAEPLAVAAVRARASSELPDASIAERSAAWHDLWAAAEASGATATAIYAQQRAVATWRSAGAEAHSQVAQLVRLDEARTCVDIRLRRQAGPKPTGWLAACVPAAPIVGVLLPRSGRFAVLADRHLASLAVGMRLLPPDQAGTELRFADAGSTAQDALDAAGALVDAGATVLIGPVSERAAVAVAAEFGERVTLVVPGPAPAPASAMSASLESRVAALVQHGASLGCEEKGWVVLRAKGSYGDRARRVLDQLDEYVGSKSLKRPKVLADLSYEAQATSFRPVLTQARAPIAKGACVLVLDTLTRTEFIARQLRRDGRTLDTSGAGAGAGVTRLLSTAEGLDAGAVDGRAALAGIVVAPVALPDPRSAFQDAYRVAAGKAADDQAILVWRALRFALWALPPPSGAELGVFDSGGALLRLADGQERGGDHD